MKSYQSENAQPSSHAIHTVSVGFVRALIQTATKLGVPIDDLLTASGLSLPLNDPTMRVAQPLAHWLWEEIPRRAGDQAMGLHTSINMPKGSMGMVEYLIRNAETLHDAFDATVSYARLLADAMFIQVERHRGVITLTLGLSGSPGGPPRHLAEFLIAFCVSICRDVTRGNVSPLLVRFQHPVHEASAQIRHYFGCDVEFQARATEIVMAAKAANEPVVKGDPELFVLLRKHADYLMSTIPDSPQLAGRVAEALAQGFRTGQTKLTDTAKTMRTSPRTLQRRLNEAGTTHEAILDDMRQRFALRYLKETDVSPLELCTMLGFSDPSAFYRAFKRWTGTTPLKFRRPRVRTYSGIEFKGPSGETHDLHIDSDDHEFQELSPRAQVAD